MIALKVLDEAALQIADQSLYYEEHATLELAQRWEAAVEAAIGSLREFPERGERLAVESAALADLRKLHIKRFPKHLILYRLDAARQMVLIVSVLHGARDIDLFLQINLPK